MLLNITQLEFSSSVVALTSLRTLEMKSNLCVWKTVMSTLLTADRGRFGERATLPRECLASWDFQSTFMKEPEPKLHPQKS